MQAVPVGQQNGIEFGHAWRLLLEEAQVACRANSEEPAEVMERADAGGIVEAKSEKVAKSRYQTRGVFDFDERGMANANAETSRQRSARQQTIHA